MPGTCTICSYPKRWALDKAPLGGATMRKLAALYRVSPYAMERHSAAHSPTRLVKAQEADVAQALDMEQQLKAINVEALQVLSDARRAGGGNLALKVMDRIHKQVELLAKPLTWFRDGAPNQWPPDGADRQPFVDVNAPSP